MESGTSPSPTSNPVAKYITVVMSHPQIARSIQTEVKFGPADSALRLAWLNL